jgi:acetyl-CoA carboxylase carboxyltransferase component
LKQIISQVDTSAPEFKKNHEATTEILKNLYQKIADVQLGGGEVAVERHKKRNKLLARERIELLIDKNTPFLELSALAANGQHHDIFPSAGIVTGVGVIHSREAIIVCNDATVKGGTYIKETIKKHIRAQEIAMQNNLPCVYMVDSGGVFLSEQAHVFPDRFDFGRIFYNQAQMSARGIPQISIVMGSCTAGGAYIPAMSDETIIVRNQGTIFIGGPPLVKAATGEEVSAEELGGAEVHTSVSGVSDHIADNDLHAIQICRSIFETLPKSEKQQMDRIQPVDPKYPAQELYGLAPRDSKNLIDPREIIARIVDGSEFHEFKEKYAPTLVTGFARIHGYLVGIIANHGVLFPESSLKGAHFVELCNFRKVPMVFLQNINGFIVGKQYEHAGIARDGAKFVHAVANSSVPKFTIIWGGSFGAGNYAMAGRAYDPNFLFMWPNARISVMGGEQAASVLVTVKQDQLKENGKTMTSSEVEATRSAILKKYEDEGNAYYSTSRLWDDGIIDPVDTRNVLAMCIEASLNKKFEKAEFGVFRM